MIRPSDGVGCESYSSILDSEKQKYFYQGSLTRHNCKGEVICPSGSEGHVLSVHINLVIAGHSRPKQGFVSRDTACSLIH
jgi:hypothetical protein